MAASFRKAMTYLGLSEDAGDDETVGIPVQAYEDEVIAPVTHIHRAQTSQPQYEAPQYEAPAEELHRIATVRAQAYSDAMVVGDSFRAGVPVIVNTSGMSEGEAKRLLDFCCGMSFALHGKLEKVTSGVFLLSPQSVEVTKQEQPPVRPASIFD